MTYMHRNLLCSKIKKSLIELADTHPLTSAYSFCGEASGYAICRSGEENLYFLAVHGRLVAEIPGKLQEKERFR